MKNIYILLLIGALVGISVSCKKGCTDPSASNYNKKAKKDNGTCTYSVSYVIPETYSFSNNGASSVDYAGQSDRILQLTQLMLYIDGGELGQIYKQNMSDMFANVGGNGNAGFNFTSVRQLKDKMFATDTALITTYFDSLQVISASFANTASNGQAGTLTSGTSKYLFSKTGFEYAELVKKTISGGVFMNQALNVYFGAGKMDVDNTTFVAGKNYTAMEHHWDEAFGYFGVPVDFPTTLATDFWGKYCNSQNGVLSSNTLMMTNFKKGRAAITAKEIADRDASIVVIRETWEDICAYQAMTYLTNAAGYFGNDQAKFLHNLNEAYGLIFCLRYAPIETRRMTQAEIVGALAMFGTNLWNVSLSDVNNIKAVLDVKY